VHEAWGGVVGVGVAGKDLAPAGGGAQEVVLLSQAGPTTNCGGITPDTISQQKPHQARRSVFPTTATGLNRPNKTDAVVAGVGMKCTQRKCLHDTGHSSLETKELAIRTQQPR